MQMKGNNAFCRLSIYKHTFTYYVDENENKVYNYPEINGDIVY